MILKLLERVSRGRYIEKKYFDEAMNAKNAVISDNQRLRAELLGKTESKKHKVRVLSTGTGDVEPTDEKARAAYVASASNFYSEILEKKIMQMIAQVREELDTSFIADLPLGLNRHGYDNFLRGTSNAFKLLMDWGEQMKGEHLSNIQPISLLDKDHD